MTQGDGNVSDNATYAPANDAAAQWQQQAALAGGRLSSEGNANFLARPTDFLGSVGSELPDFSLVNGGAGRSLTISTPIVLLVKFFMLVYSIALEPQVDRIALLRSDPVLHQLLLSI